MGLVIPGTGANAKLLVGDGFETQTGRTIAPPVNYINNFNFQANTTTGWATYADAASSTPTDGTGGAPNVTFTAVSGGTVRGTYAGRLTKDAANRQGQGVSYDFTLDAADTGRPVTITFDSLGSANYATGDVDVYIYDITNATLITPSFIDVSASKGQFGAFFIASTSTSYRLILHVATTNASAWTLDVDNFYVGPQPLLLGAPTTNWQSFTPDLTGANFTASASSCWYRQVGDTMFVRANFTISGVTGNMLPPLPTGFSVDLTKISSTQRSVVGYAEAVDVGVGYHIGTVNVTVGGALLIHGDDGAQEWNASNPMTWASGDVLSLNYQVPISQWNSNTVTAQRAVFEYVSNSNSSNTASDTTSFAYGSAGSVIPNGSVGTNYIRYVQWQNPRQATDVFQVEFNSGSGWRKASDILGDYQQQGTRAYSFTLNHINSTTSEIVFREGGYVASSATYASAGSPWSELFALGWLWRILKVSSGATVGFPVGTRNLVADSTGTAIPTGVPGHRSTSSNETTNNAVANTPYNSGAVSLLPGNYDLYGMITIVSTGTISAPTAARVAVRDSGSTSFSGLVGAENYQINGAVAGAWGATVGPWRVNVTSTTSYHAVGQIDATSGTGTANLRIIANRV